MTSDYDALSRRVSLAASIIGDNNSVTNDFVNTYLYDQLSRMIGVEQTSAGVGALPFQDKQVNFTYNAASQFVFIDRYVNGNTSQVIASSGYNYDGAGRLTGLTHSQGGTPLAGYAYTFDAVNRITSVASVDGVSNYSYDTTSQLTAETNTSLGINGSYTFDANGNRTMSGYTIGANNQILSDGTWNYVYDAEGNRNSKTNAATGEVIEHEWDYHNRLVRMERRGCRHRL